MGQKLVYPRYPIKNSYLAHMMCLFPYIFPPFNGCSPTSVPESGCHPQIWQPGGQVHAEVLGPGLDTINGLGMHAVADEELILGLAIHRRSTKNPTGDPLHVHLFWVPRSCRNPG